MPETPLTPERFAQIQAHFEKALELRPEGRSAYLDALARDDAAMAGQVQALLAAHDRTGSALESPMADAVVRAAAGTDDRWAGARVGVYQIVRRIGMGGMGTVYEAVRADDQYQMRVAVKFLRHHTAGEAALARFRSERQILAHLSHPNIAGLLDGGVTPDGQPYFVMEFVEGQSITRWCDERRLSVTARLRLFLQVCAAVEYAHQSLVVHRDLKPGNILVTGDGTVKLLDFGIAKLLRTDTDPAADPVTQVGARVFTPEFASPEQVRSLPVGTRSDGYALGVVLFELLTGTRPFDLQGLSYAEIERIICERTPPRPSSQVAAGRAELVGERSPGRLRARLAGDLDAIVLMALRKEPERRYGSAEQLAADIRNHLDGLPVVARPDSLGYRLGKLVRRRAIELAAAAVAVAALIGGSVTTTLKAREATQARDQAREVTSFLTTMLGAASPGAFGRDVQVRVVLDSAAQRAAELDARPDLAGEIRRIIGNTYLALGEFELAETQHRLAVEARRRAAPRGSYATAAAMGDLATSLEYQGKYDQADSVMQGALMLLDRFPPADELERGVHLDTRARILSRLGRMSEAAELLEEALAIQQRAGPEDHSGLAYAYGNLGMVVGELGDNVRAETLIVAGLAAARQAHGEVHPRVAEALSLLSVVRERAGLTELADSTYRATVEMRRQLLGPEHPEYAWIMFNYADFLVRSGRYAEGAGWARQVLELRGRSLMDSHPAVSTAMAVLGRALGRLDSIAEAGRWMRESLAVRRANYPAGHWLISSAESALGEQLVLERRYPEAERMLLDSEQALLAARGETAPVLADARARLVRLYDAWGKPEESARWRARLPDAPQ